MCGPAKPLSAAPAEADESQSLWLSPRRQLRVLFSSSSIFVCPANLHHRVFAVFLKNGEKKCMKGPQVAVLRETRSTSSGSSWRGLGVAQFVETLDGEALRAGEWRSAVNPLEGPPPSTYAPPGPPADESRAQHCREKDGEGKFKLTNLAEFVI